MRIKEKKLREEKLFLSWLSLYSFHLNIKTKKWKGKTNSAHSSFHLSPLYVRSVHEWDKRWKREAIPFSLTVHLTLPSVQALHWVSCHGILVNTVK